MKIGLIQTRGLGDIVIALPIAEYFINLGHEIFWPIDERFITHFRKSFPKINFLEIESSPITENSRDYFLEEPQRMLDRIKCEQVFILYSYLSNIEVQNKRLSQALTFDAYKYAICNVPFDEKWKLKPKRDLETEEKLFSKLKLNKKTDYVVVHNQGSNFKVDFMPILKDFDCKIVYINEITNCIFDWITVIERAKMILCVDSVYSNLIEQLNLTNEKVLYLRSPVGFTPIFKNKWIFQ